MFASVILAAALAFGAPAGQSSGVPDTPMPDTKGADVDAVCTLSMITTGERLHSDGKDSRWFDIAGGFDGGMLLERYPDDAKLRQVMMDALKVLAGGDLDTFRRACAARHMQQFQRFSASIKS